ncbi:TraB/GumN family protein [Rhizobium sp. G187]|uniref:TraB/GumN family protein n=1 Tax=Rhizobium sp. G187 TaxID=3451352 RepID=UPI003EE43D3C
MRIPILSLALVSLLAAFPAAAEVSCPSQSMIGKLKAADPQAFRQLEQRSAEIKNNHGLLWKIEKEGLAPSWLLGTAHLRDPRISKITPAVDEALTQVETLLVELEEIGTPQLIQQQLLMRPDLTMLATGTLDQVLPEARRPALQDALATRGLSVKMLARMRPWVIYFNLMSDRCETRLLNEGEIVLDHLLVNTAMQEGIFVAGLETPAEQFASIASLPDGPMLESLIQQFSSPHSGEEQTGALIELYEAQDTGMMIILNEIMGWDPVTARAFADKMITARNHRMAERAAGYLQEGGVLIAIGALHLPGDEGLIELIRKQGFVVTRFGS